MEGKAAPPFEARTLSGKKITNQSLKGKTIVLNFWFVGCPPCEEEMPLLNKLTKAYRDNDNVVFLSFSKSSKSVTEKFLSKNEFKYEVAADAAAVAQIYNVSGYPSHFIIDKEGIVRYVALGGSDDIEQVLDSALKGIINPSETANSINNEPKLFVKGDKVFKNEKDEVMDTQEAIKLLTSKTHRAFRKYDKDGKEYYQLKKAEEE